MFNNYRIPNMPYSLLILDGDVKSNAALAAGLKQEFDAEACAAAQTALERLRSRRPNILLLGSELSEMTGIAFLRILRETEYGKDLPVILFTARKTEESVAQAFALGVEDYMVKPIDQRELTVRIRAVLRRRFESAEHWGPPLSLGGVEIDPSQRRCVVNGKRIHLRPREFELLEILMRKAGRVLARSYLLETIWGMSSTAETRAVDGMVSRLRKRLGATAGKMVETVSKMGYSFKNPAA